MKIITIEEIEQFFHTQLIESGYVPGEAEIQDIADICFEFILSLGLMDEIEGE